MTERAAASRFVVTAHTSVRARPYATAPIIRAARVGESLPAVLVHGIAHQGNADWARVTLPSSVVGYIWSGAGLWEEAL